MNNVLRLAVAAALTPVFLAGCGDDSPTDPADLVPGTYSLQTVNGEELPFTIFEDAEGSYVVLSGTLEMRADRSYTETIRAEIDLNDGSSDPEEATETEDGFYSVDGAAIQFDVPATESHGSFSFQGVLTNDRLTYSAAGVTAVYLRN